MSTRMVPSALHASITFTSLASWSMRICRNRVLNSGSSSVRSDAKPPNPMPSSIASIACLMSHRIRSGVQLLWAADDHERLGVYWPVTDGGTPIYVHSKVLVVEERLTR